MTLNLMHGTNPGTSRRLSIFSRASGNVSWAGYEFAPSKGNEETLVSTYADGIYDRLLWTNGSGQYWNYLGDGAWIASPGAGPWQVLGSFRSIDNYRQYVGIRARNTLHS